MIGASLDLNYFDCPRCGGGGYVDPTHTEYVEFVGASRTEHTSCNREVLVLPMDVGGSMEQYLRRSASCASSTARGASPKEP